MGRKFSQAKYPRCPVCQERRERNGWCDRCKELSRAIAAALTEPDTMREREYTEPARRMEIHRGRRRDFPRGGK